MKQFLDSNFCLEKCRCCCKFSQAESVWSPCVLDEESQSIKFVGKNKKIQLVPFPPDKNLDLPDHIGPIFVCPFLNIEDNKCNIYAARPFECQIYPFLINKRGKKVFLSVDLGCPYVKDRLNTGEFKQYVNYLFDLLNQPDTQNKLKNNPQIVQAYEEALDLRELDFLNAA